MTLTSGTWPLTEEKKTESLRARRNLFSRYILPGSIGCGLSDAGCMGCKGLSFATPISHRRSGTLNDCESSAGRNSAFSGRGLGRTPPTPLRVAALAPGVVQTLLVVEDQEDQTGDPIARAGTG